VATIAPIAPYQNVAHDGSQKPSAKICPQFIKTGILISLKCASSFPQNDKMKGKKRKISPKLTKDFTFFTFYFEAIT